MMRSDIMGFWVEVDHGLDLRDSLKIINPPRIWERNGRRFECDHNDPEINNANFPSRFFGTLRTKIFFFPQRKPCIGFLQTLYDFDAQGLRAATVQELVAYGLRHLVKTKPRINQESFPFTALGSVWRAPDGRHYAATLYNDSGVKRAHLDLAETIWYSCYRFPAVPGHDARLDARPANIKDYLSAPRQGS